jgi:high-affinity nickel-transport protein
MPELETVSAVAIFALGLRHGIDPDHLAAIGDLVGSQVRAARSMLLATAYALGHGLTIFTMSVVAAAAGGLVPQGIVAVMDEAVGASLVLMGFYLLYGFLRWGPQVRLRSRWSLIASGVSRLFRRRSTSFEEIEHDHDHEIGATHGHGHEDDVQDGGISRSSPRTLVGTHRHRHRHVLPVPADPLPMRGLLASSGVGVLHGIGAETPSQIALLATAAGVAQNPIVLAAWFVLGLLVSNTLVAVASVLGLKRLGRGSRLYAVVILLAALFSLYVGGSYLVAD